MCRVAQALSYKRGDAEKRRLNDATYKAVTDFDEIDPKWAVTLEDVAKRNPGC